LVKPHTTDAHSMPKLVAVKLPVPCARTLLTIADVHAEAHVAHAVTAMLGMNSRHVKYWLVHATVREQLYDAAVKVVRQLVAAVDAVAPVPARHVHACDSHVRNGVQVLTREKYDVAAVAHVTFWAIAAAAITAATARRRRTDID